MTDERALAKPVFKLTKREDDTISVAPEKITEAYKLYLQTDLSVAEIAIQVSVPTERVQEWVRRGGWRAKKEANILALLEDKDSEFKQFIRDHHMATRQRHLDVAAKIEQALGDLVDKVSKDSVDAEAIRALKSLAGLYKSVSESLSNTAGVSARAVGMSERPELPEAIQSGVRAPHQQQQQNMPNTLVVIGARPTLPVGVEPKKGDPCADAIEVQVTTPDGTVTVPVSPNH